MKKFQPSKLTNQSLDSSNSSSQQYLVYFQVNASEPFEQEIEREIHVTLTAQGPEVKGMEPIYSVEDFRAKLAKLSPEELALLLGGAKNSPPQTTSPEVGLRAGEEPANM
jgi:hypothetical protein